MRATQWNVIGLVAVTVLAVAAFAAYHVYLRGLMLDTGLRLGAVRPGNTVYRIVPLYVHWRPRLKTGLLIATAVTGGFIWWLRRALAMCEAAADVGRASRSALGEPRRAKNGRAGFAAALVVWQAAIAVSVALIDGGLDTLWEPYRQYVKSDYIGAVDRIQSPSDFLRDYPQLMPELPLHCRHHPPGGPLVLWLVAKAFAPGPFAASLVTILFGSLAAPAVYLLAREVLDEAPARLAATLFLLAPNVVCYTATCMDAVFMTPLVWTFYFIWRGRNCRPVAHGLAAGTTAWLAAMCTFSASFVALWSVVVVALTVMGDRCRLRKTVTTLSAAALAAALLYAALVFWSGYEPLAVLRQAFAGQAEVMKGRGHSSLRQSLHFAATNLAAFLFCSGVPVVWLWIGQTVRDLRSRTASGARWLLLSFCLTLMLVDLAPLYTLETERIWIFLVGFLAIGAAARLARLETSLAASPLVLATLIIETSQTIGMEALFDWRW
ncbi:MAG TPA: glycosyltransferase family 39 protein [Pirellulales bacterium]|nr:glycosyltransferase family 39 protein [Pirellulales bacterium]